MFGTVDIYVYILYHRKCTFHALAIQLNRYVTSCEKSTKDENYVSKSDWVIYLDSERFTEGGVICFTK